MYEHILIPTDGSEQSERATDHALEIARQFGSAVHVIHVARLFGSPVHDIRVVDDQGPDRTAETASDSSPRSPERKAMEERREEAGNELTDVIVERAHEAGLDAHGEVLHGEPADQITEYARANDMDLIVLGARGRSAVGKFLIGSVAGKVARHASTPVMLVRPDE